MSKLLMILSIIFTVFNSSGQPADDYVKQTYIEVSGDAEMLVIPDEIYIGITIQERYEGKDKITLDSLEHQLKAKLVGLGIDLKNLSISDANNDLVKVRWAKKDVLSSKDYSLKVSNASQVSKVFEDLSKIKIHELNVERVSHSKLVEFKKEVKIDAIKAAKEKASYLLSAIGEQIGKPLRVTEQEVIYGEGGGAGVSFDLQGNRGYVANYSAPLIDKDKSSEDISFEKIKLEYSIITRFEIK